MACEPAQFYRLARNYTPEAIFTGKHSPRRRSRIQVVSMSTLLHGRLDQILISAGDF
jgi:hypothetical protein